MTTDYAKCKDKDIHISYYNMTGDIDFQVMVYSKNRIHPSNYQVAWQVLRAQGAVDFVYPNKIQVGAAHMSENMDIKCGPLDAQPGSTWEIIHEKLQDTPYIQQGIAIACIGCYSWSY